MGLGLATIGMVTGIVIGTMLVNYAVKSPTISIALDNRTSPEEDLDIDHHLPKPGDAPMDEWNGMTPVTGAAVFIGVSLVTGIVLHETFRRVFHVIGSDFFDKFPLFPFAIVGGVLVQIAAVRYKFEWAVNRRVHTDSHDCPRHCPAASPRDNRYPHSQHVWRVRDQPAFDLAERRPCHFLVPLETTAHAVGTALLHE